MYEQKDAMKAENSERKLSMERSGEYAGVQGSAEQPLTQTENQIRANNNQLMEKVVERRNLRKAYKRVRSNKGAPGIDGMKVEELQKFLKINWETIRTTLLEGSYRPQPVRRVEIPKASGGMRKLGIPVVLDRFIQQAIQQVLTPIFEPTFSAYSYGFRPNRSARQAVRQSQDYVKKGRRYVVDTDLEKFFDNVNHDILMNKVHRHVKDKRVLRIIRRYLQAGVMLYGVCVKTEYGTPQGGPMSPLLANIMLTKLDKELEKRGHRFVRYADDFNIYVSSRRAGERVLKSIKTFLGNKLKLKVNETKSAVDRPWKRQLLGFTILWGENARISLAPRTLKRFKKRIKEITRRNRSESMEERIKKLNIYIIGWSSYFAIAKVRSIYEELDGWIRRRLRACLLKQWKRCKTKLSRLKALGLSEKSAGRIAFSRKKYWRLARTPQTSYAMSNAYWQEQGVKRLVDRL